MKANDELAGRGVVLHGGGFLVTKAAAFELGLGRMDGLEQLIRPYLNGRDITKRARGLYVIDAFGLSEADLRLRYPSVHQHLATYVKPERDHNPRQYRRENWWLFGENNPKFRAALSGLPRYIATVETMRHRAFQLLDASIIPDNKLVCVASADAALFAVLSSNHHVVWSLAAGGWLGVGNDSVYVKSRCFDAFPFPELDSAKRARLATLGEELDAFRKQRQAEQARLTLTDMYNVLAKLRADEELSEADKRMHEQGLVSTLKRIHDEIDEAVAAAYGWRADLSEEQILDKLVVLNKERAEEEKRGLVRWLRPEFQKPSGAPVRVADAEAQTELDVAEAEQKPAFPDPVGERARAVRQALIALGKPATPKEVWQSFQDGGNYSKSVRELLETMAALGQAVEHDGRYFAA